MVYEMRGYRIIYKMRGPEKVKKVFPGGKLGGGGDWGRKKHNNIEFSKGCSMIYHMSKAEIVRKAPFSEGKIWEEDWECII